MLWRNKNHFDVSKYGRNTKLRPFFRFGRRNFKRLLTFAPLFLGGMNQRLFLQRIAIKV